MNYIYSIDDSLGSFDSVIKIEHFLAHNGVNVN